MGVPSPEIMAWAIAALLIVEMIVATVKVHGPNGFSVIHIVGQDANGPIFGMPGYELNLLYIAPLLSLAIGGPGSWSIGGRKDRVEEHAVAEDTQRVSRPQPAVHELER
jgi:uncharacterized membrane protein YphA (DoxX/SURF4 family)